MSNQWGNPEHQPFSSEQQPFRYTSANFGQASAEQRMGSSEEQLPMQQDFPVPTFGGQQQGWPPQPLQTQSSPYYAQSQPFQTVQQPVWQQDHFPYQPVQSPPPRKPSNTKKIILQSMLIFAVVVASVAGVLLVLLPRLQPRNVDVIADFGNRQNTAYPIRKGMFGLGYNGFEQQFNSVSRYLPNAGITALRAGADLSTIFPTQASATNHTQQVWTTFDAFITTVQALGAHPIIILNASPLWLQPQTQHPALPNPCSVIHATPSHVKPVFMMNGADQGVKQWGALAAQVVAHVDQKFPGVNADYEIWNEPDGVAFMCVITNKLNAEQIRLTQYRALYAAAAPLMKQQAQRDNRQISIGGPTLAFPAQHAKMWFTAFVNDPLIAPYIDFISYHHYITGKVSKQWSDLFAATQDQNTGAAAIFEAVSAIVHAGKQPHAQSTPIYIDEYNTNTKLADCCRNNQTYAPLWNAVFVSDLFSSVLDTHAHNGAAQAVPARLLYFTANRSGSQFCMFGTIDTKMDCALQQNIQPYPQYYAYQLLSDPAFLGLTEGGYLTSAPILQAATKTVGLLMTDFYTSKKDDMLIVNTSGQTYQSFNVALQNTGNMKTDANIFTLNPNNARIGTQHSALSSYNNSSIATITIPPYSIVAISLDTSA